MKKLLLALLLFSSSVFAQPPDYKAVTSAIIVGFYRVETNDYEWEALSGKQVIFTFYKDSIITDEFPTSSYRIINKFPKKAFKDRTQYGAFCIDEAERFCEFILVKYKDSTIYINVIYDRLAVFIYKVRK